MTSVENSSRCPTNADGEKCVTVEDEKVPWLPALVGSLVDASIKAKQPYEYDAKKIKKSPSNPNNRHKLWMIPAFLVQWFVARPLLVRSIRHDIRKARKRERYAYEKKIIY